MVKVIWSEPALYEPQDVRKLICRIHRSVYLVLLWLVALMTVLSAHGGERAPEIIKYYDEWIGCHAPSIHFDRSDRIEYAETSYKGKKTLLYSFDAGNFCDAPDLPVLIDELTSLQKARQSLPEPVCVVGYTRGIMIWAPYLMNGESNKIPDEIDEVSRFPIVNLNNKRDDGALGEPYELLKSGPGAIVVGTNGIICKIFTHPMNETDFREALAAPVWTGPMKEPPLDTSAEIWARTPKINVVVAKRDLEAGTILAFSNVTVNAMAESMLLAPFTQYFTYDNVTGKVLNTAVVSGQPFSADMFIDERGELPVRTAK